MSNILISGGTGLVGTRLSMLLLAKGYKVAHLTRSAKVKGNIDYFEWDLEKKTIDPEAVSWSDSIIHLAGESVSQSWTKLARQRIATSRVEPTNLIYAELKKQNKLLNAFVSASAIGFYGADTGEVTLTETSDRGTGFLSDVVVNWETAVDQLNEVADRVVKIRTGIVLSASGGALPKMMMPVKLGIGSGLGSGKQWMSWIHIDDLCNMFIMALEKPIAGIYNGVAPNPVTNNEFTEILARVLKKPLFLPNVPAFALRLVLGSMSEIVLGGNKVEPVAFLKEGYNFEHKTVEQALEALLL